MNITYTGHAGYFIESRSGNTRMILDPWLQGSTYVNQAWLAWSYPGPLERLLTPDFALFTHYHKDHFNPESVARLSKRAEAVVPTTPAGFFRDRVQEFGFAKVHEVFPSSPLSLGDFEVHSIRVNDHWEFLDETAYLVVEGDTAALFLADLWYLPRPLLQRLRRDFRLWFAAVPWGGGLQDLAVLPDGFRLESFDEYYRYGTDEALFERKNAELAYDEFVLMARAIEADVMVPAGFGFGMVVPGHELVRPAPISHWLDQQAFIQTLPDPAMRARTRPMYAGDQMDSDGGARPVPGSTSPNTRVSDAMRAHILAPRDPRPVLDGRATTDGFRRKVEGRLTQLRSWDFYEDGLSCLLAASRQIEFQIVNESRQVFLFEQDGERFRLREVSGPTGARDIVYLPPAVMTSLVSDWGPCWTEAEFSGLVKVSASGWSPYLVLRQLLC